MLSPDGSTIAFTTYRDLYVLGEPQPVGSFSPQPTESELYVIHLASHTLERAVVGYGDAEPAGSTRNNPTLSADGSVIAFISSASNLLLGMAIALVSTMPSQRRLSNRRAWRRPRPKSIRKKAVSR